MQLSNGITVNTITSFIKEYEVKNNVKIDGVCVDYLDYDATK